MFQNSIIVVTSISFSKGTTMNDTDNYLNLAV